jgi:hypothetical protein
MPEPHERLPISSAPISAALLAHNASVDTDEVVTAWIKMLDGLDRDYELLLVNDGSTDDTGLQADAAAARWPRLRVFHHSGRLGMGVSLRTAIAAARYPLFFYTTCDKQFQPADLQRLLDKIDKVDLVSGYRIGPHVPGWLVWFDRLYQLFARVVFGVALEPRTSWLGWAGLRRRLLARWIFGVRLRDSECAFRLFRRELLQRFPIQSNGSLAQIEIIAKANFLGAWMAEAPVTRLPRPGIVDSAGPDSPQTFREEVGRLFKRPEFAVAVPTLAEAVASPIPVEAAPIVDSGSTAPSSPPE